MPKASQVSAELKTRFNLENHLLLAQFIANKIGFHKVSDIKQFSDVNEGIGEDGRSYMYHNLLSKKGNTIPIDKLGQYDENICRYFQRLKKNRGDRLSFKYYQYLALLFSEIYLDNYFQNPIKFLNELNQWVDESKSDNYFSRRPDLQKIAYWMATGSGKTLIMHANYWQFLAYNKGPNKIDYENIILITTGDPMSKQHLDELKASGIPSMLFQGENGGYFEADKSNVKVISIHKLREEKKGEGVTIDISTFGRKNLLFVDEGHKGQKTRSEKKDEMKWKNIREKLGKDGFTFEYSATFGQVVDNPNEESFKEYSKAIIFDYSYKHFHGDGYGKEFSIINMGKKEFTEKQTRTLLLANAIAFYEQLVQYRQAGIQVKEYNIEKPLWIFIGSKVQKEASDVFKVVQFLNWLLCGNQAEIQELIGNILKGQSGIIANNKDVFALRNPERNFAYFREKGISTYEIYNGIFTDIFYTSPQDTGNKLHLIDLKETEGEIGLSTGTALKYFAVINIGDKRDFLKMVEEESKDIIVQRAVISNSLFEDINKPDSTVNMLIGSRKFAEGWNSWRVSTMSLLYVGEGAGPQIIQLFGRGVRLKGKDFGLKRSQPPRPPYIELLETLHIFGIQANYMEKFKKIMDDEGVFNYEIPLPTKKIEPFPTDLQIIGLKQGWSFDQELLRLEPTIDIKLDMMPPAFIMDSRGDSMHDRTNKATTMAPQIIRKEILDILDWDDIFYRILEYKNERGFFNIAITKEALKNIIYTQKYKLLCDPELIEPKTFQAIEQTTDIVTLLLQKYLILYYSKKRNAAEKTHIELKPLKQEDENILTMYRIQLDEEDQALANHIQNLIDTGIIYSSATKQTLSTDLKTYLPGQTPVTFDKAYFQGHLYQPLLAKQGNSNIVTVPTGLNTGEATFVEDLKNYINTHQTGAEIYLLRNLTRSKGVGFYEAHSFYPDFILWVKKGQQQIIVFIDPKGLIHMDIDDPKLKLHEFLKNEIEKEIGNPNIKLDAFVISVTPFRSFAAVHGPHLTMDKLEEEKHILFQSTDASVPNKSCIDRMFKIIGI
ncbi:MAG: DEAD/DEAH box helicase family protein [Candidatus Bathyarchaeota archaeon]|nr:DEAD/DEAH box helicase family protein [Candidatus Bathyarchaeota archaeon]